MFQKAFIGFFLLCQFSMLIGQDISIGEWRSHLPYLRSVSLTQSDEAIIYSTPWSVFSINKSDESIQFLTKVEGLSDIGILKIRYDQFNDQLFIIYTNGNIDIVKGESIINVPNILNNSSITGSKNVNDIFFENSNSAFIATDFGIVSFDPNQYIFGVTIITGVPINQISSSESHLFAASDEGVYSINRDESTLIADFEQWSFLDRTNGLPSLYSASNVVNHNGRIYIGTIGSIYKSTSDLQWELLHEEQELKLEFLTSTDDRLIAGWIGNDFSNRVLFFGEDDSFFEAHNSCNGVPKDAIRDENGRIWYADFFDDFRSSKDYTSPCDFLNINSPYSEKISDITIKEDMVLVASGGVAENFTFLFSREGFYLSDEGNWTNFNEFRNSKFRELDLLSVFRVAFHPNNSKVYAGSYWAGLLEYDLENDNCLLYNKENSTLRGSIGDPQRERITGLQFDESENLWVATYNAPEPINVLSADGDWISIEVPSLGTLSDLEIDELGYKWFTVHGSNGGVLVYDSGESIQNLADDQFRFITSNNSELTTNNILSIAVDLDGEVWVGTDAGVVLFDCGQQVFDESICTGVRRKVLQDSIAAFLLADQQVNAIAVDGADRKWFGTRNGLFVQSPQGDEQIVHFTTQNSPLFDDVITALAYDGSEGIMWIGTNKGLLSFRTETTSGTRFHSESEVYAFPNPVDPGYAGPIAIRGLVSDANVKITDINGNLVAELTALGGQAVWNGMDSSGELVASGVYLVFSTDQNAFDRPDSFVTKIMILR